MRVTSKNLGLSYRVLPEDGRWRWEVLSGTKRLVHGLEPSCPKARAQAFLFLMRTSISNVEAGNVLH
jgi:hypothetical protein